MALKPLGSSEGKQLKGLVKLLQKRLAEQKAFLPNEMEKLRYLDRKRRRWREGNRGRKTGGLKTQDGGRGGEGGRRAAGRLAQGCGTCYVGVGMRAVTFTAASIHTLRCVVCVCVVLCV